MTKKPPTRKILPFIIRCRYDELVRISELKLNPKNPNKHNDSQIETYQKILKYQGIRRPVIVSKRSGLVICGHGQIEASKRNGWEQVPVNFQEYDSEESEYAHMIADNALARQAELDFARINVDVPDLGPDFDIELLGIPDFEIEPADKEVSFTAKTGSKEYGQEQFERFDHKCPRCSFEFDEKNS